MRTVCASQPCVIVADSEAWRRAPALLYLPQAKIYTASCAVGPWIVVGHTEDDVRQWSIQIEIRRGGDMVFAGETRAGHIKRPFTELVA